MFSGSVRADGVIAAREFLQEKRKGVSRTTVTWQKKKLKVSCLLEGGCER